MIGYVTLGTNDIERAVAFYDALLAEMGASRQWETARGVAWGLTPDTPHLALLTPYDGKPATVGNGVMAALRAPSKEVVDRVHAKALSLGAKDEGAAGPRGDNYYAGYFRDPDGNKLSVYFE